MDCHIENKERTQGLGWETLEDIDWDFVAKTVFKQLSSIFGAAAKAFKEAAYQFEIQWQFDEFFTLEVWNTQIDGQRLTVNDLASPVENMSKLAKAFDSILDRLADEDRFADCDSEIIAVVNQLAHVIRNQCSRLEQHNFWFPKSTKVTFLIKEL